MCGWPGEQDSEAYIKRASELLCGGTTKAPLQADVTTLSFASEF